MSLDCVLHDLNHTLVFFYYNSTVTFIVYSKIEIILVFIFKQIKTKHFAYNFPIKSLAVFVRLIKTAKLYFFMRYKKKSVELKCTKRDHKT